MPVMIFNYGCGFDIVILHAIFVISELFILGYIIRLQVEHSIDLNTTQSRVNELNSELQYTSSHDMLTGLPNRIYLHEQLQNIKNLSETNNKRFALIFLDLDHFKNINDTLGHDVGDALLKTVANILTANLPKESLITRIGGDEFILVISNFEDPSEILPIINILLQEFRNELLIKGYSLRLSVSMGISIYPNDSTNIKELMKYSDIAMYKAKSDGRDNFSFFTQSLNNKIHQEVDLINDMQRAYYDNEFELYYQPKVDVKTQKIIGAEALIRWNHKTRGMIGPNIFIALAESTGFILSLGKFVIGQSTKDIKEFSSLGLKNLKISINVSTRQFQNGDLYTDLKSAMQQSKIDPKQLGIEITESIMMQHVSKTIATLQSIKDLGISIYIDDFGTGYSSLAYLKSFPIDTLKIDKTFVDDIRENESNDGIILNTILAMGKSLGLKVIAEGVEEKYQFEYLKEKECDIIQGYYFAKPMKKEDFIALLQK
jgi:diguanylate cyclase (GGDEF)-like protein